MWTRNIKIEISYDGTNYSGWQSQKNARTIQSVIEKELKKITGHAVKLKGAGRTDAGVHARQQAANFKTSSTLPAARIKDALNSRLPRDILITAIKEVPLDFNSQHHAKCKTYRYTVTTERFPDPLQRHFTARFSYPLNMAAMTRAARKLKGRHDFRAFQASGSKEQNTVRRIKEIRVEKRGRLVYIDICADGFLYNMARTIAGTLLEIGRGRFTEGRIKELLTVKNRARTGPTLPAKGLCLMKVEY